MPSAPDSSTRNGTWSRQGNGVYRYGAWTLRREHYADGPSLYDWILYRDGTTLSIMFGRMRDARQAVKTIEDRLGGRDDAIALYAELTDGTGNSSQFSVSELCDVVTAAITID